MSLDSSFLIAFLAVAMRVGAMLLAAPLFGGGQTPPSVRALFAIAVAFALSPLAVGHVPVPETLYDLGALVFREIAFGLVIGFLAQIVLLMAEIAGSFLDYHMGFGMSAMLNPLNGIPSSTIGRFKFMMAMMLLLAVNGHHIPIAALVSSYEVSAQLSVQSSFDVVMKGIAYIGIAAIQIALPVAAVGFVVDAVLGIINRAAPQINVLMTGISGKILAGMVAISLTLPSLAYGVNAGIEYMAKAMHQLSSK